VPRMNSSVAQKGRVLLPGMVFLLTVLAGPVYAQVSTRVLSVIPDATTGDIPLTVRVQLLQAESLEAMYFLYRPFGETEYRKREMDIVGNTGSITILPREVVPPFLEYYLVLVNRDGTAESYPLSGSADPFDTPPLTTLRITVQPDAEADQQILFLSPEPQARVAADDVLISVSLLRADSLVVRRATQILLDGVDVSSDAVQTGDIIVYAPQNHSLTLSPGIHKVTVRLYDRQGYLYRSASLSFIILGQEERVGESSFPIAYRASVQLESRHELIGGATTPYNRGRLNFTGDLEDWRLQGSLFITSDEYADRQPQNRFFLGVESAWLQLSYGDTYPSFPTLIMTGKRLRGVNSSLRLGDFNVDVAAGQTVRRVEGSLLQTISIDSLAAEQLRDPGAAFAPIDSTTWGKFRFGTYARDLFVVRPSFGSASASQFGLTFLKGKDDLSSIRFGVRPQENFLVGADFITRFDNRRIELSGQGVFSAYNTDISSGSFTDAYIDSVYPGTAGEIKTARDILQHFITVNDNLRPLSLSQPSTTAYELSALLNYLDNSLRLTYLFRGSNYTSFGQTFLRTDIRGFNISDRVRLVENQVLLSLTYERLRDNTSQTKIATTTFSNVNVALSYYPRIPLPSFTVGYGHFSTENGLSTTGIDSTGVVSDLTNRIFLQTSYDFDLGARHTALVSYSLSDRDDRSLRGFDIRNASFTMSLSSRYGIPLQTSIDLTLNLNRLPSGASGQSLQNFDYTSLSLNARYAAFQEQLMLVSTVNPVFGDFRRTVVDLGADLLVTDGMHLLLQFTHFQNSGIPNDRIWTVTYRYDL